MLSALRHTPRITSTSRQLKAFSLPSTKVYFFNTLGKSSKISTQTNINAHYFSARVAFESSTKLPVSSVKHFSHPFPPLTKSSFSTSKKMQQVLKIHQTNHKIIINLIFVIQASVYPRVNLGLKADDITALTAKLISDSKAILDRVAAIPDSQRTYENTILPLGNLIWLTRGTTLLISSVFFLLQLKKN